MTDAASWTLKSLFFGRRDALDRRGGRQLERGDALAELRRQIADELGKGRWRTVAVQLGKKIAEVLDIGIVDRILLPAWSKLEQLQQYRDRDKFPPEETVLVPLHTHTVSSTHAPEILLKLNETELGRLALAVELELELEGILLEVRDARIRQIQAGRAAGRGQLSCSFRDANLYSVERRSRSYRLAGGISLGDGFEIPALE